MKAIVYTKYGSPDVLNLKDVEKPVPKENEILVKVYASSVSTGDARLRRADPFLVRLFFGILRPKVPTLGGSLTGEIEAIGQNVKRYKIGDQIFASTGRNMRAHAEYATLPEDGLIAIKPENKCYAEIASIPFGDATSLFFLKKANIQAGQKILIIGASGSLGVAAVQLAKYYGTEVHAVCSNANTELVKSLGADRVFDYTKEDFTESGESYDIIFDTIGKISVKDCLKVLGENGQLILGSALFSQMLQSAWISMTKKVKIISGEMKESKADLEFLASLYESGKMRAVIDRIFPLEEIREAHRLVDSGRKKGNVILSIHHLAV